MPGKKAGVVREVIHLRPNARLQLLPAAVGNIGTSNGAGED